jgi:Tfp pilus assembly protein PilF
MGKRRKDRRTNAAPVPRPQRPARLSFWLAALILVAAALALYWSGLRYPLVFDDQQLTGYALKSHYAAAARRFQLRWLSDASFWWIHAALGSELVWQRLANVLLHAATATALFGFLSRLFEAVAGDKSFRWLAFFGAAWFLLHPVAVYGVAYLIERSIILATLFSIVALWCLLEGMLRGAWPAYAASVAAYLLAVSAKEHAVMVPAVGAALAVLVKGASIQTLRRLAVPFALFGLVGVFVILRTRQLIGSAYEPWAGDVLGTARGRADIALAYPLSVLNQATLYFRYLATWIVPWPSWMSIDIRTAFPRELASWPYVAGLIAWLAYPVAAVWLLVKRGPLGLLGFGLLCPWLLALTEVAAARAQEPFVLYRSYLWMSGLPAVLPALLGKLAPRWRYGLLAALVVVLAAPALERLSSFSSAFRLWDDAVRKNQDLAAPYVERAYHNRGLMHLDANRLDAAREDFEQALRLNPGWPDAYVGRGSLHLRTGDTAQALADFDRAIALDPKYASAYDKRCLARTTLQGPQLGVADCEQAVKLDPANQEAWTNLGAVYHALTRSDEAAASYQRALDIAPTDGPANYNYGALLLESGRRDDLVRRHIVIGCNAGVAAACDVLKRSRRAP